ncbi:SEL1-like repeat protein [Xylocopilactobacillus apicola]|uniref:Sel1 repeat family protein n=1 Tax=Xylocopilactobacillus apicola TaxID=2932184 RepID=A0AAU9DHA4_9LACO|nr:SEL1-like repeat protein [Xylocopilactobacillus apicola]BDR57661.1 hypothetical protein XA3_01020 [Xylocopilactobacillus apicola]
MSSNKSSSNIYFYLDFFHKNNQAKETIHITTASPGLGLIDLCLGVLKWKNEHVVLLYQNNKRDYWEINITTKETDFIYEPAISGNPHGQYNLAISYLEGKLGLSNNMEKAIFWLNKSADQGFSKAIKLRNKLRGG